MVDRFHLTWSVDFSKHSKDSPNVKSPMISNVTKLNQDVMLMGEWLFSRSFWMNISKYLVIKGSCSRSAFSEKECEKFRLVSMLASLAKVQTWFRNT